MTECKFWNMYYWVKAIIFHSPELLGHFGMIPLINHNSSEGEQWGRSEVVIIYPDVSIANHIFPYHSYRECFAHCFTNLNVQGKTWISQLDGISCNINHRSNTVQLSYSIIYSIFGYWGILWFTIRLRYTWAVFKTPLLFHLILVG